MAVTRSSESSINLADTQLRKDLNNIWPEYYKNIECDSTERIKWLGDLDALKLFVRNLLGDVGKWLSPSGSAKAYYYMQSDITWYTNKRSLHFHGKDGIALKNLLIKFCKDGGLCNPSNVPNTALSNGQSNVDNSNIENCGKCHDYSRLIAEMAEIRSKLDIVYQNTEHLYLLASDVPCLHVGIGETKTMCEIGTQTCEFLQQESERQRRNVQCSCVNLSTDIEGLKLDIVIAESKAAGNFQSNKQAIDQLRNELNLMKSRNQNCLPYNANLNQNENNVILQNQPDVQSQTKELNNIVSTQDLVSVIMKADPVVIIESENHNQITRTKKDQGRSRHADKAVKGSSNSKSLCPPFQNTQTSKTQNIDRKPIQSSSKDIKLKSYANKPKFQHEWINRLPLIGTSRICPPKKQPSPANKFKPRWRTTSCDVQDTMPNVTSRSCDRKNPFYNHPHKKKPPLLRKGKHQRRHKNHLSGRYRIPVCNTQTGTNLFNPIYKMNPSQLKSDLQLIDKDPWEAHLQQINSTLDQFGTLV